MGVYEVTNAHWKRVMGSDPSKWKNDDGPVEKVSWDDAVEFCQKLSAFPEEHKAGRVYRLPPEAEWEYACRAGTDTTYSFGENESTLGEYGWFDGKSGSQTQRVGQKKANAWALLDMQGNAWELCSDWYRDYPKGAATDPQGPSRASARVSRGGSLQPLQVFAVGVPLGEYPSRRYYFLGFRLALSPSGGRPVPPEAPK